MKYLLIPLVVLSIFLTQQCALSTQNTKHANSIEVKQELEDILSAKEYNRTFAANKSPIFLEKIIEKIERFLMRLSRIFSFGDSTTSSVFSFILACIAICAFVVLVVLIIIKLRNKFAGGQMGEDDDLFEQYDLPSAVPLLKEAAKLAETGNYRGAFKCAYLASISYLDDIKALRFERNRTNWEYLSELRAGGHEGHYETLKPVTVNFDRKFYGGEQCMLADYEQAIAAYNQISAEAAA